MCLIGRHTSWWRGTSGHSAIPCGGHQPATSPKRDLMPSNRFWAELKSSEFAALDPNSTIAVLPVAAIEQHGPHLPVMTDTAIAQGMIETVLARLPADLHVLFLPIQTIGKSNEHLRSPGTITFTADNLIRGWFEIEIGRASCRERERSWE